MNSKPCDFQKLKLVALDISPPVLWTISAKPCNYACVPD